jgi:hypothetical protein
MRLDRGMSTQYLAHGRGVDLSHAGIVFNLLQKAKGISNGLIFRDDLLW